MSNPLKYLVYFAALVVAPYLMLPIFALSLAVKGVSRVSNMIANRSAMRGVNGNAGRSRGREQELTRRQRQRQVRNQQREAAKEWSLLKGFDYSKLPFDMKVSKVLDRDTNSVSLFESAGIPNLVRGEGKGLDVKYTFEIGADKLSDMQRLCAQTEGAATISRGDRSDRFVVEAGSAVLINELAKQAYPKREVNYTEDIVETRQYRMEGFKSYEEAVEAFKKNKDNLVPENTVYRKDFNVDGVKASETSGQMLDSSYLAVGTFIINEDVVTRYSGRISVPGNVEGPDATLLYVKDNFEPSQKDKVVLSEAESNRLSNGTSENVQRYLYDETNHRYMDVKTADSKEMQSMKAYVELNGVSQLSSFLNEGKLPEGSFIQVSDVVPSGAGDRFVVEIDPDYVRSKLAVQGDASPSVTSKFASLGLSESDQTASMIVNDVRNNGHVTVRLKGDVDSSKMKVDGVPVTEIEDRMANKRLPSLNKEGLAQWVRDAGQVQSVSLTVDTKKAVLRIQAQINDRVVTHEKPLNETDIKMLSKRGVVSKAEMKDLVMQINPTRTMQSYMKDGANNIAAPEKDFVKGVKPRTVQQVLQQERMQEKRRQLQNKDSLGNKQAQKNLQNKAGGGLKLS